MGFMHFADNKDVASAASSVEGLLFCAGDKGGSLLPRVRAACCLRWCREKGERAPLQSLCRQLRMGNWNGGGRYFVWTFILELELYGCGCVDEKVAP